MRPNIQKKPRPRITRNTAAALREEEDGGQYFTSSSKAGLKFIPSGSPLLDLVLGGGWVLGRMINIVGDKSTGKTLLAMEAIANFLLLYPDGKVKYKEAEAAFDPDYARALGIPIDKIDVDEDLDTVEDLFRDLEKFINKTPNNEPGLYILDSLDSLSDEAEMGRSINEGSYNMGKPKQMSALFRRLVRKLKQKQIAFIVVSQVRDNIGVTFGRKSTRSGGRALDFYASQVLWLAHLKTLSQTVGGVKRPTGIEVRAKCDKNKIGLPLRQCDMEIRFGYGIDDIQTGLMWLKEIGKPFHTTKGDMRPYRKEIETLVRQQWNKIETTLLPKVRKYT